MAASQLGTLNALMWENPEPPTLHQSRAAARDRSADHRDAAEGRAPAPRRERGDVPAEPRARFDDRGGVVRGDGVAAAPRAATREVVGRDQELDALQHEFERAQRGKGRLVVISAEAGMGKTTLVDAFLKQLEEQQEPVRVGRGRCSERLAGTEAYLPVLEALDSLQKNEQLGSIARLIRALAPSWYAADHAAVRERLVGRAARGGNLVGLAGTPEAGDRVAARGTRPACSRWCCASTTCTGRIRRRPICSAYLARRIDSTRLLMIATCRPSDLAQARHPFLPIKLDLHARGMCREIMPGSLDLGAVAKYIALQFPEHTFPSDFARLVHERSEGNPLFMADLLRDLRRRQQVRQKDGRWMLADDLMAVERELPESIRSAVQRKIESLDDADRRLLGGGQRAGRGVRHRRDCRRRCSCPRRKSRIVSIGCSASTRS